MNDRFSSPLTSLVLVGAALGLLIQSCSPPPISLNPTAGSETPIVETNPQPKTSEIPPEVIKVAILVPLTGIVSAFGISTENGARMAIDEWNASGGVLGNKIVPVVEDSQCGGPSVLSAANKVIDDDGVHYIIGEVCSSASITISEIAESRGVVQISPISTDEQLTVNLDGTAKKFIFRASFTDSLQSSAAGQFALESLRSKKAFILYNNISSYSIRLADGFEKAFITGSGEIVGKAGFDPRDTDFSVISAKIVEANPDIIFLGEAYPIVNFLVSQMKQKGVNVPFIGTDGWDSPDLEMTVVDGSYFSSHFSQQDQNPRVLKWVEKYKTEYGMSPDSLAALGYDATNILLASIAKAGRDEPTQVAEIIAKLQWEGVTGTITYNEQHNPIKPVVILQVKNGNINYVTTVNP